MLILTEADNLASNIFWLLFYTFITLIFFFFVVVLPIARDTVRNMKIKKLEEYIKIKKELEKKEKEKKCLQ